MTVLKIELEDMARIAFEEAMSFGVSFDSFMRLARSVEQAYAPVPEPDYDPLTCDYCDAETSNPWHGSGLLNGEESRHIHACDACKHLLPETSVDAQVPVAWCVPDALHTSKPNWGRGWMFSPIKQSEATLPLYAAPVAPPVTNTAQPELVPAGWQQRYIDPDFGPTAWQPCTDTDAAILRDRPDYQLRRVYAPVEHG